MKRCRVHILRAGACSHPQVMTRRDGSLKPVEFPALAALILHPDEGAILFDTGYDPAFFEATRTWPEILYRWMTPVDLKPGEAVAEQLPRFGVGPEAVRAVVVSHFHGDHVAGLHRFPNARIFCARAGLEQVHKDGRFARVRQGVLASLAPADIDARAVFFEDRPQ